MDFITVLQAVTQFHEKLDQLVATATANKAILDRLQIVLDHVVDQLEDFSNRFDTLEKLNGAQKRLDEMLIDASAASSPPSGGQAQT